MYIIALPVMIWQLMAHQAERHEIAWFVAGVFVIFAIPISVGEVVLHLYYYNKPKVIPFLHHQTHLRKHANEDVYMNGQ